MRACAADVDLTAARLTVRQQRLQVGDSVVVSHAKTDGGKDRRVSLGAEAVGALLAWRLTQDGERAAWGMAYQDGGWVFTYEDGRPLIPSTSRGRSTDSWPSRAPRLNFHGLRHEHTSLLLTAGMPITAVSKRLGHAGTAITGDLYSHLQEEADRRMAHAAGLALGPRAGSATARWHTSGPSCP